MSISSDAVKRWRKNTKIKLIQGMGGKCFLCGYNKCNSALEFHHIDPTKKDFGLGSSRASIKSLDFLIKEVEKCVILCSNCHREYHDGIHKVDFFIREFDRQTLTDSEIENDYDECPICKKNKKKMLITCSRSCASKRKCKIDWNSIDLKNLYLQMPIVKIAEMLGISDVAVHKRLKKIGLK